MHSSIHFFLDGQTFAVAGASTDPAKFGNRVFRALRASGRNTYPLNPKAAEVDGHKAYASIYDLPEVPDCLAIITPPAVTLQVVAEAIDAKIKHLWMQPGAQHPDAIQMALDEGLTVVHDGTCLLIVLEDEH